MSFLWGFIDIPADLDFLPVIGERGLIVADPTLHT